MANTSSPLLHLSLLAILFNLSLAASTQYNVVSYGAKPDGRTHSTKAFMSAWTQACGSSKPSTIYVPSGKFLLKNVDFKGPCKNNAILIRIDGTLMAPSDYKVIGNAGNWIFFDNVKGVTVSGGVLDGQGAGLWSCKASGKGCPSGATASGVKISGITYEDIHGLSTRKEAVRFDCSETMHRDQYEGH